MAYACPEAKAGGSLELRTAWSTEFLGQPGLHRNPGAGRIGEGEEKPLGFMTFYP